jgi:hypothetical protein
MGGRRGVNYNLFQRGHSGLGEARSAAKRASAAEALKAASDQATPLLVVQH